LPDFCIAGGLRSDEIANVFPVIDPTRVEETGRDEFRCGVKPESRFAACNV